MSHHRKIEVLRSLKRFVESSSIALDTERDCTVGETRKEEPMSYDVFISYYSGSGKDFARYLKKYLMDFSLTSFLDEEDIPKSIQENTDEWRNYIDGAIKKSRNFILIMTLGFNKRKEIIRELKLSLYSNQKKYFLKHEDVGVSDLVVETDDETKAINLSKYEYIQFGNEIDLLRKVVSALLGKIGQPKESSFMIEARNMISSEGLEFKKTETPFIEMIIGPSNDGGDWLPVTPQNKFLISRFPYNVEIEVRRKFFESKLNNSVFYKVTTNGFFHVGLQLFLGEKDSNLFYFDTVFYEIIQPLLFAIRIMKFHNVQNEQTILVLLKNVGNKTISFESWARYCIYSFTNSLPEIEFSFSFCPKDEWKEITSLLLKIYRELCCEAGCIDILDSTIKDRVRSIIVGMQELRTEYTGDDIRLPRVDFSAFGFAS